MSRQMSGTGSKICGFIFIIIGIFLLLGGLYLPAAVFPVRLLWGLDIGGVILLVVGILMYKVLKR